MIISISQYKYDLLAAGVVVRTSFKIEIYNVFYI
jgi:hypothetical protein